VPRATLPKTRTPSVLFISHDASRTGATLLLLHLLQWLRKASNIPFSLLLRRHGPLTTAFAELCQVFEVTPSAPIDRARAALRRRLGGSRDSGNIDLRHVLEKFRGQPPALIYSNTLTNGEVLRSLAALECPVLTHAHELDHSVRVFAGDEGFKQTLKLSTRYIAGSEAVREYLRKQCGVPDDRMRVVRAFINTSDWLSNTRSRDVELRQRLGISERDYVVGAIGTVDWRKGADVFVRVARSVSAIRPARDIHFIWIGTCSETKRYELMFDARRFGVGDRVHFVGAMPEAEVAKHISTLDLLCLPSREEPFGIVMLEAACRGLPTVCFADAGGAPEFVEDDCGYVVPYLDDGAMAARIVELVSQPQLRAALGQRAKEKTIAEYDVNVAAPKIAAEIRSFL
jgi:glycosyltransferase involved in cell wall biosynthesis